MQIEAQRDALTAQVMNVERTVFALETAKDTQTTVSALREATKQLKVEHEKISISEVEDIQDDLAELLQDQEEMQEILGRSYGLPDGLDEADLEAELAGLETEFESAALEEPAAMNSGGLDLPALPALDRFGPAAAQGNAMPLPTQAASTHVITPGSANQATLSQV